MAILNLTGTQTHNTSFGNFFRAFADRFAKRREYNQTIRELSALDRRALADLGISRSEICAVAYAAVYQSR